VLPSLREHAPQAVRGDADARPDECAHRAAAPYDQAREALRIAQEASLSRCGRRAAEAAVRAEDRWQRQPHAGVRRELATVGERCAVAKS
jgi:hypothetical protein